MKKILFIIPTLGQGGAEKVLVNLVNNMDKSQFDVTVKVLFAGGVNEQFLNKDINLQHYYKKIFPANSYYLCLFSPKRLFKKIIPEHYDIIVSFLEGPTARIVSGCTDENTKLISWIHCKMDTPKSAAVGFRSFSEAKKCYNRFYKTIFVSEWVKNYFVETFSFNKDTDILYNVNETAMIQKLADEKIDDVSFNSGTINICSVGSVKKVKGFKRLAAVHKRLIESGFNIRTYILGIGPEQNDIEKYIKENNLQDSFYFLGYKTNPYKYVKRCDLYVCSSYSEGFSTTVSEAMIVGTPVVTTLCSGMQEMLGSNDEYGIVTDNNEDALFAGVKKILTEPGMLDTYAKRAKERGQAFSTEKTTGAVEEMLNNL